MHHDDEIDKELQFHVEERVADLIKAGVSVSEARRRARLEFGGMTQARESTREQCCGRAAALLWQDVQYGWRRLRASPGFSLAMIATIAIGIGACSATFAVVNAVLLRPLPFPESDKIVLTANHYPKVGNPGTKGFVESSVPDYYDRLEAITAYAEQAMHTGTNQIFEINGAAVLVKGIAATPSLFQLLRVKPAEGRSFDEQNGEAADAQQVILSHGLAEEIFGRSATAVGQSIRVSGRSRTVIGVMAPGFLFMDPEARFWIPLVFAPRQRTARHSNNWWNVARLKPGATVAEAQAQVNALNAANMERFPADRELLANTGFFTRVERLQDVLVGRVRPSLYLLWGGAFAVLLIGAVNVMNLALARSSARMPELSTRFVLGAGRLRVTRMLVVEGLMLAIAGGAIGVGLSGAVLKTFSVMGLEGIPRASEIQMDGVVLVAALALSCCVGLLIGLMPLLPMLKLTRATSIDRDWRTVTAGYRARILRRTLVVAQVALTLVLMMGAGLLLASFRNLLRVDPGFVSDEVVTARILIPTSRYPTGPEIRAFTQRVLETVRNLPGVVSAGATSTVPFAGDHNNNLMFAEGYVMKPGEGVVAPDEVFVSASYLETMGITLLRGRYFTDADTGTSGRVAIVDERLADRFWRGDDPIGKRMYQPQDPSNLTNVDERTPRLTVVGVVRNVQTDDLAGTDASVGTYYLPMTQVLTLRPILVVKSRNNESVVAALRAALARLDATVPLSDVRMMTERTALSLLPRKRAMALALGFAGVALFLAAVGIYGVLTYSVAQRTREIGIRIALGSTARGVFALVIREGLLLVAVGLAMGLAGAIGLRRIMQGHVYGISALDPFVLGLVITTLGMIALLACVLPARRATQLDPILVLNQQ